MNRDADRARRVEQALRNTRKPPRNQDADQFRRQRELELLKRLYGQRGGAK